MIEKINVTSDDSFKYLREQLNMGGKTLSNYISLLPLENGKIYSFVPEGISEKSLYQFDIGGIYSFDKELFKNSPVLIPIQNDARLLLIKDIYEYLDINDENCCVFEEPNGRPQDKWIKNSKIDYVHIADEVFYFFDKKNNSLKQIEDTFKVSEAYYFLCSLGSLSYNIHNKFTPLQEIGVELLKEFVDNLNAFFVKAYDGEGYLMWTKW
jgi:hypothetical protein